MLTIGIVYKSPKYLEWSTAPNKTLPVSADALFRNREYEFDLMAPFLSSTSGKLSYWYGLCPETAVLPEYVTSRAGRPIPRTPTVELVLLATAKDKPVTFKSDRCKLSIPHVPEAKVESPY